MGGCGGWWSSLSFSLPSHTPKPTTPASIPTPTTRDPPRPPTAHPDTPSPQPRTQPATPQPATPQPATPQPATPQPPTPTPQEHGRDPDTTRAGIDVVAGAAGDMAALGVFESFRVKDQVVTSAVEAAEMILRVDDIIRAAPRRRG